MKQRIKYNLNDYIWFKLMDKDIYYHKLDSVNERLRKLGLDIIKPHCSETDENGYSHMQLWCFMETFGPLMIMGGPNVIEPLEIEFEIDEERNAINQLKGEIA